ncbi:MAG TPA: MlaD family protein, partial [bacterium]
MKKKYSELKVGVAVFLALLILVLVITWGKGYTLIARSRVLEVRFDDIAGLEEGAFVLVNGMRKGKVLEFILEQEGVRARCALDQRVKLYDDARFEITATELMGSKVVNIWPGISGKNPSPGVVFQGESGGG